METLRDVNIQKKTLEHISDQNTLEKVVMNTIENEYAIRKQAAEQISDQTILFNIINNHPDLDIQLICLEKMTDPKLLRDLKKKYQDNPLGIILEIRESIDQKRLMEMAVSGNPWQVRKSDIEKINDEKKLLKVLSREKDVRIIKEVLNKIRDNKALDFDTFFSKSEV